MNTELNSTQLSALADAVQNAANVKKRGRKPKQDASQDAPAVVAPSDDSEKKKVSKKKDESKTVVDNIAQNGEDAVESSNNPQGNENPKKKKKSAPKKSDETPEKPKKSRVKKGEDVTVSVPVDSTETSEKPKRKRAKKEKSDVPKPKRALGPYMLFAQSIRSQLKQENPTLKCTELAKLTGERWRALSEDEKKKFVPVKQESVPLVASDAPVASQ